MTRLTRTAAALAIALVAAAGLSGCSDQRLGAAAVVDGKRISTDDVQKSTRDYLKIVPGADPAQVQRDVLQRLILAEVIDKVAHKEGVGVSDGRVAAAMNVNLWDDGEDLQALVESGAVVEPRQLSDPQVPLATAA